MGLGNGKTEHSGPRDMTRKSAHWGHTHEAKSFATRARRRDEDLELQAERSALDERSDDALDDSPTDPR